MSREYKKRKRAEAEEETRLRITEAAVELHGTVGPARTTVSAIADRAGVQRATVYRHFPDEEALFEACSTHWNERNAPPDPGAWAGIEDPRERLRTALSELYAWYGRVERMLENLYRDAPLMPAVGARFNQIRGYFDAAAGVLVQGRGRGKRVRAAIGLALAFETWQSLVREQALNPEQAVALMADLVEAA
jgi:AcrR family transcriptional regulator